jgi:hypothetical protein
MFGSKYRGERKAAEREHSPAEPESDVLDLTGITRQDGAATHSPAVLADDLSTLPPSPWPSNPSRRDQSHSRDRGTRTDYFADYGKESSEGGPLGPW